MEVGFLGGGVVVVQRKSLHQCCCGLPLISVPFIGSFYSFFALVVFFLTLFGFVLLYCHLIICWLYCREALVEHREIL